MTRLFQSLASMSGVSGLALALLASVGPGDRAFANGGPGPVSVSGVFVGNGLVTAVSGDCTTAAGDTFTAYLETPVPPGSLGIPAFGPPHGQAFLVRESLNTPADFGVVIAVFPSIPHAGVQTTGSYRYGLEGQALATGTYQVTFTPLDSDSFLVKSTLTYIPLGGSTTCAETDQVTYIRAGFGQH